MLLLLRGRVKRYGVVLVAALVIGFLTYVVVGLSLGIPQEYLFGKMIMLSGVNIPLKTAVQPEIPITIGEDIKVLVTDNRGNPVADADVVVMHDGAVVFTIQTNRTGQVTFGYPGETTMIKAQKVGYQSDFVVIPKIPDKWIRDGYNSALSSIATAIVTAVVGYLLARKKKHH